SLFPDCLAVSPDAGHILIAEVGKALGLWTTGTNLPGTKPGPVIPFPESDVEFSPNSRLIAEFGADACIHILDVQRAAEAVNVISNGSIVRRLTWSPDSKLLLVGKENGGISLVDWATGAEAISEHLQGDITQVAFSPDGKRFAAAASTPKG